MRFESRRTHGALLALALAVGLSVAAPALLALRQAPSFDETLTLAQAADPSSASFRAACGGSGDTCPVGYYGAVWILGRAGVGLGGLRALSVLGWGVASLALGATVLGRGGRAASVFVAAAAPSASGLLSQGMVARPYGVAMGALAIGVWTWSRSLARPTRRSAVVLAGSLLVASTVHLATMSAVVCFIAAELLARRSNPRRTPLYLLGLLSTLVPVVALAGWIRRSIEITSGSPSPATALSYPSFYGSALRPLAVPAGVAIIATAGLVLAARRKAPSERPTSWAGPGSLRRRALARELLRPTPYKALVVLLAASVPAQLVAVTALTRGAYFHRYALGGLVGLVLIGAEVVRRFERSRPWPTAAVAAVVAASIPFALHAATHRESPLRSEVAAVSEHTGVATADGLVLVPESYLRALLGYEVGDDRDIELVLTGPARSVADRPAFDIYRPPRRDLPAVRALLVADSDQLEMLVREGRVVVTRRVGEARLSYGTVDRHLVGAVVLVVPS